MGNNSYIYCYANCRVVNFEREYQPPPAGTKILVIPQFSCMPDQILGKNGKTLFSGQNLTLLYGSPFPKYKDVFKHLIPNFFGYRQRIAKLLLKHINSFWSYLEKGTNFVIFASIFENVFKHSFVFSTLVQL